MLLLTFCLGLAGPVTVAVAAPPPGTIQKRVDALLKSGRYQTQLPSLGQVKLDPKRDALEFGRKRTAFGGELASGVAQIFEIFAYVAGGVLAVSLLVVLINRLNKEPKAVAEPSTSPSSHGLPTPKAMASLAEAERLAERGEYSAAAHILLLYVIEQLRRQMPVDDALTTRELLRAETLSDASRQALEPLVRIAEYAHFGGYEIGPDDFERCRSGYGRFTGLTN